MVTSPILLSLARWLLLSTTVCAGLSEHEEQVMYVQERLEGGGGGGGRVMPPSEEKMKQGFADCSTGIYGMPTVCDSSHSWQLP